MAGTQIVNRDDLLAYIAAGGSYTDALSRVLGDEDKKVAAKNKKSTVASRKAELAKAVSEYDVEVLMDLQVKMQNYVDSIVRLSMDSPRSLTHQEALELMVEHEDYRKINEFLAARREAIRTLVFASIDAENAAKGLDPDSHGGQILVPELGKKFAKEGAGYKPPSLDVNALRLMLGPEDAAKVFEEEVIPAQTVQVLSEEKLMQLAAEKPDVMETIRAALIPGAVKTPRFTVPDYTLGS